jgi:hypothetical protein
MGPLVWGKNGIAALTFDQFPVGDTLHPTSANGEAPTAGPRQARIRVERLDGKIAINPGMDEGQPLSLELFDLGGRPVHRARFGRAPALIPVPGLRPGVYLVKLSGRFASRQCKVVIP